MTPRFRFNINDNIGDVSKDVILLCLMLLFVYFRTKLTQKASSLYLITLENHRIMFFGGILNRTVGFILTNTLFQTVRLLECTSHDHGFAFRENIFLGAHSVNRLSM